MPELNLFFTSLGESLVLSRLPVLLLTVLGGVTYYLGVLLKLGASLVSMLGCYFETLLRCKFFTSRTLELWLPEGRSVLSILECSVCSDVDLLTSEKTPRVIVYWWVKGLRSAPYLRGWSSGLISFILIVYFWTLFISSTKLLDSSVSFLSFSKT